MGDDYGDSWNGGYLQFSDGGVIHTFCRDSFGETKTIAYGSSSSSSASSFSSSLLDQAEVEVVQVETDVKKTGFEHHRDARHAQVHHRPALVETDANGSAGATSSSRVARNQK